MMPSQKLVFLPDPDLAKSCYVSSSAQYKQMYQKSIENPAEFWGEIADNFYWKRPIDFDNFHRFNFDVRKGPIFTKWLDGATTNISYNLLDRNIRSGNGKKIAFYWEGNDPKNSKSITYSELLSEVCRFANVLKSRNVQKGDRVAIYMPMILEAVITMLACTRIGAVHSLVFAGFSADSFAERITDCQARVLVTADATWRGQKLIKLKTICDESMDLCQKKGHTVDTCIVVAHLQRSELPSGVSRVQYEAPMLNCRDFWWHEVVPGSSANCPPEWMQAEDPLFLLYTSGSTGKPKGVLHTTGGYLLYAATTFKFVFDYKPGDIYWCTADIGWITGHTYVVYGPLANAATSVIYEGTPFYPTNSRYWEIVEKYKVNQFYTAPTAIRTLMKFGEDIIKKNNLTSLRVLGSVGEPINPEAWLWYYKNIGREKCSIVDTYWQTETGGHIITPLPGVTAMKPGAASSPFFGVQPILLDDNGQEIEGEGEGYLVFSRPWPGIMRTLFNNHDRYEETYFKKFPGYYFSGDGARRDSDGYLWVTGRVDDMLNVSGHLMSTAEVESVLTEHKSVTEAAVVARPHPIKGECLYCFITTADNTAFDDKLQTELKQLVRERIGPFAQPDVIHHAPGLPKTRSGKIMRRILRKIAQDDHDIGDISTLADSGIVEVLFKTKPPSAKTQS